MSFQLFESKLGAKVGIWLDELPEHASLSNETVIEQRVLEASLAPVRREAAIEIFRPFGGSFHYGLLGGHLSVGSGTKLDINVPIDTPSSSRKYEPSLASRVDTVVLGSTSEYTNAIFTALQKLGEQGLPYGHLAMSRMAHGAVGSAPVVFSALSRAIISLLTRPESPGSFEAAIALMDV